MSNTPALTADRYGVEISGEIDFEEWADQFTALLDDKEKTAWGIADMVIYAEERDGFDGMYSQFLDDTRLSERGLINRMSLARRFPRDKRLFNVGISYYEAVRTLPDDKAFDLLNQAAKTKIDREAFRVMVKKVKQEPTPDKQALTLTWDAEVKAYRPSVAPKLWAQDGYSFEVTLREKKAA